jgi:hypothetical protein
MPGIICDIFRHFPRFAGTGQGRQVALGESERPNGMAEKRERGGKNRALIFALRPLFEATPGALISIGAVSAGGLRRAGKGGGSAIRARSSADIAHGKTLEIRDSREDSQIMPGIIYANGWPARARVEWKCNHAYLANLNPISRGAAEDEGLSDLPVFRAGIDHFAFDVRALKEAHLHGKILGVLGMEIAHIRAGLQDKWISGGFHAPYSSPAPAPTPPERHIG